MSSPPVISALPAVPATSDPNFETLAPALFTAIKNTFISEVNSVASWINAGSWLTTPPVFDSCTILGNLTVDTNTLFVDAVNNRVGIGTINPGGDLTVVGSSSDAWALNSSGLTINGNASGISTITTFLDASSIRIGAGVGLKTGLKIDGHTHSGGSKITFQAGGSERMLIRSNGNVGIGADGSLGRLDVRTTFGPQLALGFDGSNYTTITTNSSGDCTISPTGDGLTLDASDIRINQTPAGAAGSATGTYARINFNGTYYKLALLADS